MLGKNDLLLGTLNGGKKLGIVCFLELLSRLWYESRSALYANTM